MYSYFFTKYAKQFTHSTKYFARILSQRKVDKVILFFLISSSDSYRFLRTADFELYKNDDVILEASSVDECVDACTNNEVFKL